MPSYDAVIQCPPAVRDTLARTAHRWPLTATRDPNIGKAVEALKQDVIRSTGQSEFLTRLSIFDAAIDALGALSATQDNWDSYGSPAPSARALSAANRLLESLRDKFILPAKVLPSAEGGVAFTFLPGNQNRAVIELLNNGEEFILLYDRMGNSQTFELANVSCEEPLERLKDHLRGLALAAS